MIGLAGVSLVTQGRTLLQSVSCTLAPKDVLCIVGASGSGKSLLFSLLLKENTPTTGTVEIDGIDLGILPVPILQLYRQRLGTCFQQTRLLSNLSIAENLAFPEILRGHSEEQANDTARKFVRSMGIHEWGTLSVDALSPGQRHLVSVARAFIGNPSIILLDEPMAALDEEEKSVVMGMLKGAKKQGASILIFTRDGSIADEVGARTLHLTEGVLEGSSKESKPSHSHEDGAIPSVSTTRTRSSETGHSVKITAING